MTGTQARQWRLLLAVGPEGLRAVGLPLSLRRRWESRRALHRPQPNHDRGAGYYDCELRLLGSADDIFHLFDAALEFPPEDAGVEDGAEPVVAPVEATERLPAAGWYAVPVTPSDSPARPG